MNQLLVTSHVLLWVVVIVQSLLLVAMMRQVGALLLRVGASRALDTGDGPGIGSAAPWLPPREMLDDRRSTLLTFLSTGCGVCDALVPAVNAVALGYGDTLQVVAVLQADAKAIDRWAAKRRLAVATISSQEAFSAFGVEGTPYAVALGPGFEIAGKGGVNHLEQLEALIRSCAGDFQAESAPEVDSAIQPTLEVAQ